MYYNLRLDMMKPKVNENFLILNVSGVTEALRLYSQIGSIIKWLRL